MIDSIYISHTAQCTGWDLDNILKGTIFKKACRTSRWPMNGEGPSIKMLDWDYRKPNWDKHLTLTKQFQDTLEVVMAPDLFHKADIEIRLIQVSQLLRYIDRVIIPIHCWHDKLHNYEVAYPNAKKFNPVKKNYWLWDFKDSVTHILGGSPQSQYEMSGYFPNLKSIDGNTIFQSAVRHGSYWDGNWISTSKWKERITNEEAFRRSVKAVNDLWQTSEQHGDHNI